MGALQRLRKQLSIEMMLDRGQRPLQATALHQQPFPAQLQFRCPLVQQIAQRLAGSAAGDGRDESRYLFLNSHQGGFIGGQSFPQGPGVLFRIAPGLIQNPLQNFGKEHQVTHAVQDPLFGRPGQDAVAVVAGAARLAVLGADVMADEGVRAPPAAPGAMEDIMRSHQVPAVGALHQALQQEDTVAAVVAHVEPALAPVVGENLGARTPDLLRPLEQFRRDQRLVRGLYHAVGFAFGQVGNILVLAVDCDLGNVAAVA